MAALNILCKRIPLETKSLYCIHIFSDLQLFRFAIAYNFWFLMHILYLLFCLLTHTHTPASDSRPKYCLPYVCHWCWLVDSSLPLMIIHIDLDMTHWPMILAVVRLVAWIHLAVVSAVWPGYGIHDKIEVRKTRRRSSAKTIKILALLIGLVSCSQSEQLIALNHFIWLLAVSLQPILLSRNQMHIFACVCWAPKDVYILKWVFVQHCEMRFRYDICMHLDGSAHYNRAWR